MCISNYSENTTCTYARCKKAASAQGAAAAALPHRPSASRTEIYWVDAFIASFRLLPGEKAALRVALMSSGAPVLGLRPTRAARLRGSKEPKLAGRERVSEECHIVVAHQEEGGRKSDVRARLLGGNAGHPPTPSETATRPAHRTAELAQCMRPK